MTERVSTGVRDLDPLISGGFYPGSLILVAGNPGTGKTIFSAQFLYRGIVECGESGIYVSFAEGRDAFYENMRGYGFNFEDLEREGKFKFLDMTTVRAEGVSPTLNLIIDEVHRMGARRLVIDSFSAMTHALKEVIETRIITHLILSKIVKRLKCTTILIAEIPIGREVIGMGVEEFISDGIIRLKAGELDGRLLRDLEIIKMRGTEIQERKLIFTLKGEFKVFPPFKIKPIEKPRMFQPIEDSLGCFSTGSKDLDEMLGGGFPKGASVLLEIDRHISTLQYHIIVNPIGWNFLVKGRPVMVIPSPGVDYEIVRRRASESGLGEADLRRLLRVCIPSMWEAVKDPCVVPLECEDVDEDYRRYLDLEEELMKGTGQHVLRITGVGTLRSIYGDEATINILNLDATRLRERGNLGILILKPDSKHLVKAIGAIADMHFKMTREHGALLFYGIKPRTCIYAVEADTSKGYLLPKLTPIK